MDPTPEVEILLVEDNPADVELTLRALTSRHLANQLFVCRDGAEAIDFFFGNTPNALRDIGVIPRVILLDLNLPKVDGLEVLRRRSAVPAARSQGASAGGHARPSSPPGTPRPGQRAARKTPRPQPSKGPEGHPPRLRRTPPSRAPGAPRARRAPHPSGVRRSPG